MWNRRTERIEKGIRERIQKREDTEERGYRREKRERYKEELRRQFEKEGLKEINNFRWTSTIRKSMM